MVNNAALDDVFSALADPTRRRIVERLARGPLTAGEIASGFSVSQPAISRHLRVLEESGLLRRTVVGRVHRCSLSPEAIDTAAAWIERQREFWNATLDRLGDLLAERPQRRKTK
ncbi:MAG TPA: metalloregulator ArsR/SmtB family transcription factor [Candidatus Elarobacter sp.]|jgi:DNA-binding transcriptional ArsR family regulator|nr:metalloregulator ArsR/SmtB family transcription factor [Candidatus Elarobacter sp.]